jgi:hypothetical protein
VCRVVCGSPSEEVQLASSFLTGVISESGGELYSAPEPKTRSPQLKPFTTSYEKIDLTPFSIRQTCTHRFSVGNILRRGVAIVTTDTQDRHLLASLRIDANHTAISALPILPVCWYRQAEQYVSCTCNQHTTRALGVYLVSAG